MNPEITVVVTVQGWTADEVIDKARIVASRAFDRDPSEVKVFPNVKIERLFGTDLFEGSIECFCPGRKYVSKI